MAEHVTVTTQALAAGPPTRTSYQQLAAEVVDALDQIIGIIPKLDEAEASSEDIAPGRLTVPEAFIAAVIDAVEQSPELGAGKKFDPVDARVYRITREHASDGRSPMTEAQVAHMKRALARKVPTKAEREERRLARAQELVAEMERKEVQKAA